MVNSTGRNGHNNGTVPSDEDLEAALRLYFAEGLRQGVMVQRLKSDLGYTIGRTTLQTKIRQLNIPQVRNPLPEPVLATLICEKMSEDTSGRNGPATIKHFLALEGIAAPRSIVRRVMHSNDPSGAERRYPGAHNPIRRSTLTSPGVWAEVHADGHEKFASLALDMGPVGIPIYGMREKFTGSVVQLVAVPNARCAATIGHVHLDMLKEHKVIPFQMTVDKGSETGYMYANHTALRENFAPELDSNIWPAWVAMTSTHNIPIENIWARFRKQDGHNIADVLKQGKFNGLFNPGNPTHVNLFQWLWPPIVQGQLDFFRRSWNTHYVRFQREKSLPSGGTPNDIFSRPEAYGGDRLGIPIDDTLLEVVDALRETIPISREEVFRWVDDEFKVAADDVYDELGRPELKLQTGWHVFSIMAPVLDRMYDDNAA